LWEKFRPKGKTQGQAKSVCGGAKKKKNYRDQGRGGCKKRGGIDGVIRDDLPKKTIENGRQGVGMCGHMGRESAKKGKRGSVKEGRKESQKGVKATITSCALGAGGKGEVRKKKVRGKGTKEKRNG